MKTELFHGDCLEQLTKLKDGSVDVVIADPPYGITDSDWDSVIPLDALWRELKRVVKPTGVVAMTSAQPFTTELIHSNKADFKYCWYWDKLSITGFQNAKVQPLRCIEEVCVFYDQTPATYNAQGVRRINQKKVNGDLRRRGLNGKLGQGKGSTYVQEFTNWPKQLLEIGRDFEDRIHPTQKPVALMAYLIRTYSNAGETVLDFCMGSGTTGVAAMMTDRNFIGIEANRNYFAVAKKRIEGGRDPLERFATVVKKPERTQRVTR